MAEFIYQMYQARKAHGDKVILDDVTLSFYPGAKIGVVGPNGMGKSTLLKIMAGIEEVSNGDAKLTPGYTVGILQQEPPLDDDKTVIENVRMAFGDMIAKVDRFNKDRRGDVRPGLRHGRPHGRDGKAPGRDRRRRRLGYRFQARPGHGRPAAARFRHACQRALWRRAPSRGPVQAAARSSPTCCCSTSPRTTWTPSRSCGSSTSCTTTRARCFAVTHDRYFLDNVAEWICEVDRGHLYPYKGNYPRIWRPRPPVSRRRATATPSSPSAWRPSSSGYAARPRLARQRTRPVWLATRRWRPRPAQSQKLDWTDIRIPVGPRLGNKVLEAHHLHKEFDGRVLIDDLSFTLPRNGIVGVIGPNGVGKTTLFKTIVGLEPLTSGELEVGETVKISYVDQNRSGIDPDKNLWEVVSDGLDHMMVGETEVPSRAYVASFGFKGQDQQKRAGVLSGGERNRLNLALTLKQGGNLLLLDEPTNDLDVETLSSLEAALLEFPGCSVVISHDRMFLDRVATHILAWEGTDENPGNWYWFEGNFEAYQANRIERLGEDAAQPHRIHRKLTRD